MKKALILALFAAVLLVAGTRCTCALNNKTDQFFAGRYGGVNCSAPFDAEEMKVVEDYGIDWFWLQHQGIIPMLEKGDPGVERLKKLCGRTRIIYRGWFLGSRNIDGKLRFNGDTDPALDGKDWLNLADDSALLDKSLAQIDRHVGMILGALGKDSLYAISIGEEEPHVGMSMGRGIDAFGKDVDGNTRKLIKVNNAIYNHLKERYPNIKVMISYYPDALPAWAFKEFKQDGVVMDAYPALTSDTDINAFLKKWLAVYPPSEDVYLLLLGMGSARQVNGTFDGYSLLPRKVEVEGARKIFDKFYNAGYRNIGWFGYYCKSPVLEDILTLIDEKSPGTYRDISPAEYAGQVKARIKSFESVFAQLSISMEPNAKSSVAAAFAAADRAEKSGSADSWQKAIAAYNTAVRAMLSGTDASVERLRGALAIRKVASTLNLPANVTDGLPADADISRLMGSASVLETLPEFYKGLPDVIKKVDASESALFAELGAKYAAVPVAGETAFVIRVSMNQGKLNDAVSAASTLLKAASDAGMEGRRLEVVIINPYGKPVNARPSIAISSDGSTWKTVYEDEPFHAQDAKIRLAFPVDISIRYVRISSKRFVGWFNLDSVRIAGRDKAAAPESWETSGDVRDPQNAAIEDGKVAKLVNGKGIDADVTYKFPAD